MKPVITVGHGGLSDALISEFERALTHHELIKVKVSAGDRAQRDITIDRLCAHSGALLIQRIGHVGLLFRKSEKDSKFSTL